MALGWGLWEGPARFIFRPQVFQEPPPVSANCPGQFASLEFPGKWHNIRHDDELEIIRLRIDEAAGQLVVGRFATVAATARTLWHF